MNSRVSYELRDSIATIAIDDGKMNVLSSDVFAELNAGLDRALQPHMHDEAMRREPDGPGEHTAEMEWALPREIRQRGDLDRLMQVGEHVVPEPIEHRLA